MNKFRNYFLGDILKNTEDVFEHARAILLLRLNTMFLILFVLPVITDIALGYKKAVMIHGFAFFILFLMPFIIKKQQNINRSTNLFFAITFAVSFLSAMILNPVKLDPIGIAWEVLFLVIGTLMLRGKMRMLFCCFLLWLPPLYVIINASLKGVFTVKWMQQVGVENPPIFLLFFPIVLAVYTIWTHTETIATAKKSITEQKQIIEEKQKEIIDSINYAKRIQNSLLPTEKYIDKSFKRLKDEKK